jgi:hypothetical protein
MPTGEDIIEEKLKADAAALLKTAKNKGKTFEIDFSENERPAAEKLARMLNIFHAVIQDRVLDNAPSPVGFARVEMRKEDGRNFLRGGIRVLDAYHAMAVSLPASGLAKYAAELDPRSRLLG